MGREEVYTVAARAAAKDGSKRGIKQALQNGADVNAVLIGAAVGGHLNLVKYAYQHKAGKGTPCEIALREAIKNEHLDVTKYLVKKGTTITSEHIEIAIHKAIETKDYKTLQLLDKYASNQIESYQKGAELAALSGDTKMLEFLRIKGINLQSDVIVRNATRCQNEQCLEYLHKNGVDICDSRIAAIVTAAEYGQFNIMQYLYQKGASVRANDNAAIMHAAKNDNYEMFQWLHRKGADLKPDIITENEQIIAYCQEHGCKLKMLEQQEILHLFKEMFQISENIPMYQTNDAIVLEIKTETPQLIELLRINPLDTKDIVSGLNITEMQRYFEDELMYFLDNVSTDELHHMISIVTKSDNEEFAQYLQQFENAQKVYQEKEETMESISENLELETLDEVDQDYDTPGNY